MKRSTNPFKSSIYLLSLVVFSACGEGSNKDKTTISIDSSNSVISVDQIMSKKPVFKGLKPYVFYNREDTTYLRVVANSKKKQRVSLVYYDNDKKDWTIKRWEGAGVENKIIGDTSFVIEKLDQNLNKSMDIYMAYSDDGQTWQNYEPNEAVLSCSGDPHLEKHAQLLVSNDFMNSSHTPSLGIVLQWQKPSALKGNGITQNFDFSFYCNVLRKLPRTNN